MTCKEMTTQKGEVYFQHLVLDQHKHGENLIAVNADEKLGADTFDDGVDCHLAGVFNLRVTFRKVADED